MFSSEDLQEIRTYRLKQLDNLAENLQEYIDSFKSTNEIDSLYEKVKKDNFHPLKEPSCEWAQATIYNCLKLYIFNYFPLNDQTEIDVLQRIWSLIDTVFDHSCIDCRRYFNCFSFCRDVNFSFLVLRSLAMLLLTVVTLIGLLLVSTK